MKMNFKRLESYGTKYTLPSMNSNALKFNELS